MNVHSSHQTPFWMNPFQKRFIADLLSGANLTCGILSMIFAHDGRFDLSFFMLLSGIFFDGFDGAAARRWGGSRWGVYSDDIADGVNYGVAPGFALFMLLGGIEGAVVGTIYTVLTISRLVYFTLNKASSDPGYFAGVPSPAGGLIVASAMVVLQSNPLLVATIAGASTILMTSYDTRYRHIGRAMSQDSRLKKNMLITLAMMVASYFQWGAMGTATITLMMGLGYALLPMFTNFARVVRRYNANDGDAETVEDEENEEAMLAH